MPEPKIYVLARPSFTNEFEAFLQGEGVEWKGPISKPAERLVEFAGRICYMSFGARQSPRTNSGYIQNLIVQGHESVLEHVVWTFLLTNVSRAFTHQLVRHRAGFSFSQLSQQYHDESEASLLMPEGLETFPDAADAWRIATETALGAYRKIISNLLSSKVSKEKLRSIRTAARSVLPNATETKIVVTANARAIRHFLNVRGSIEGDLEMRRVSKLIYSMLLTDAAALVQDFKCQHLSDGTPEVVKINLDRQSLM
jgi:thymidylate synthase (FAD)